MEVYVETVILNNFFIDTFVILLTLAAIKLPFCWWRILLSSVIGTAFGVFYPLMNCEYTFFLKFGVGIFMALIMAKYSSTKQCAIGIVIFFSFTFALGGVTSGLINLLSPNMKKTFSAELLPFFVSLGLCSILFAYKVIFVHIISRKRKSNFETKIVFFAKGKTLECDGYRDSGNKAYYKGKYPIIMVNEYIISQLFGDNKTEENDFAEVKTVVGKQRLRVFPLEKVYIVEENCFVKNVMLAVSEQNIDGCDALLHCDI